MHLIIPYAASHALHPPQGTAAWSDLHLPHLQTLLGLLQRRHVLQDADDTPLHMPHERLHAQALGWSPDAAALPWAAWQTGRTGTPPQAWMTPCHWQIGMDQVVMADPAHLRLSDEESQQLLQAMQPFLQEDGLQVTWHSPLRWHAQGPLLADLACASLDRVIDQNVKHWMPSGAGAQTLQRLQSEMQMLLYHHPVNDAREARRQHTVNAFWLHGAGALPAAPSPAQPVVVSEALRASALRGDAITWQQAWQTLDATAVADLLQHVQTTGEGSLSLCSEHTAHTYTAAPVGWRQRIQKLFNKTSPAAALNALITP